MAQDDDFDEFNGLSPASPRLLPQLPSHLRIQLQGNLPNRDLDELFNASSDPPMFSSDDLPASSAENYMHSRRKNLHARKWYDNEDSEPPAKRSRLTPPEHAESSGSLQRNFDSGVYLPDEEEEEGNNSNPDVPTRISVRKGRNVEELDALAPYESPPSSPEDPGTVSEQQSFDYETLRKYSQLNWVDPGDFVGPVWPYWQLQPRNIKLYHKKQREATVSTFLNDFYSSFEAIQD